MPEQSLLRERRTSVRRVALAAFTATVCLVTGMLASGLPAPVAVASSTGHSAPSADVERSSWSNTPPLGDDTPPLSDDTLLAAVEDARTPASRIPVEMITSDTVQVARQARDLGAIITGSVPGELIQALVPAGSVGELAAASSAGSAGAWLRSPLRISRPPSSIATGGAATHAQFGALTGQNVALTNATAWQAAGNTGIGVKVGIVDFFDLGLWNTSEQGPKPDASHQFCLDTSGSSPAYCPIPTDGLNNGDGQEHGVAVAEVVKDMAPGAELYIATVGTTADLRAVIDWFSSNGVSIITRSLGSPYDGPGDGTGPLDAVVDYAAARGITWFNSAGNDAAGGYGRFTGGVTADGYVDFDNGPGVDTTLSAVGPCIGFDGIRWANDWGKPADQVTDYTIEISTSFGDTETFGQGNQVLGAPPLEVTDLYDNCRYSSLTIRMKRTATGGDPSPDVIEVGLFSGHLEAGHSTAAYSAAKPVVDSFNPALISVGAIDPPAGGVIATYSSQGPTNDGRVKPDVAAPSCVQSTVYNSTVYGPGACFNGTSAASPTAAGFAALLLGRGLALAGAPLASLVRHLVTDLGAPGADNAFGTGRITLPSPPAANIANSPAQFVTLSAPQRLLDTRASSPTPGARIGPFRQFDIVDVPIPNLAVTPITAVAVSIVSVDSVAAHFVQALPTMMGQLGGFANLNVAAPGQIKPNFAIVPVGLGGSISLYMPTGGNIIVDLMGYFTPAAAAAVSAGRYVPVDPVRVLDTRPGTPGPVPAGWADHQPSPGETVVIAAPSFVPVTAAALVLNLTAVGATGPGFLRAQPTGATGLTTANGNYVAGTDSGTMAIVPIGADGTVSIFTSASTHIVADITGYITGSGDPSSSAGLFVPITPGRGYDSRSAPNAVHSAQSTRTIQLGGLSTVPIGANAVSVNFATDQSASPGFLTAFPSGGVLPLVSNLNFSTSAPISNAAIVRLAPAGAVDVFVNQTTHVIIDLNGYFTGPT